MPKTIYQTISFKNIPPARIYGALMDSKLHSRISRGVSRISKKVGEPFTASGGYIQGIQLELVKNKRIVQAWRGSDWPNGYYSIAIFDFKKNEKGTKLEFTHMSVPDKNYKSISQGWRDYYWKPIKEILGRGNRT